MSEDQSQVLLRRFRDEFRIAEYATDAWLEQNKKAIGHGLVLDLETTGLNSQQDKIIEIAMRSFFYNKTTGELLRVGEGYNSFQDPGMTLSEQITKLTGIKDEDVFGKNIDVNKVAKMMCTANIIIAHNAGFDRPFLEKFLVEKLGDEAEEALNRIWACSYLQIDWMSKEFETQKLKFLCYYHGFFYDTHRALADADALLHLLSFVDEKENKPYLFELLNKARLKMYRIVVRGSLYDCKDALRGRKYQWAPKPHFYWHRFINEQDLKDERDWIDDNIKFELSKAYGVDVVEMPYIQRFKYVGDQE